MVETTMTDHNRSAGIKNCGGLICRLVLPDDPHWMDWSGLISSLKPHVSGFLVDFERFRDAAPCPTPIDGYLETLLRHLPPERPLLIQITRNNEAQTLKRLQQLDSLLRTYPHHAAVFWVDIPLRYHSNRGLASLYQRLGRLTSRPFVLENDPHQVERYKRLGQRVNIRTHILKALVEQANIAGLIHYGDLRRSLNYSRAAARVRHFAVLDGDEARFIDYPGKAGVVSFSANAFPSQWSVLIAQFASKPKKIRPDLLYDAVQTLRQATRVINESPLANLSFILRRLGFLKKDQPIDGRVAGILDDLLIRTRDLL